MMRKLALFAISILSTSFTIHSLVDDNYFMGGQNYYQFGSSYYFNPGTDYRWSGDGWIFSTGYRTPSLRCQRIKKNKKCTWCNTYHKNQ